MNETISVLLRRSVRKYIDKQINEDDLNSILETALYAPTGGNHQYTRFFVVQNKEKLEEINNIVKTEFRKREIDEALYQNKTIIKAKNDNYNFMFHAPVLIIVVSDKDHGNSMADSANAIENIQIAAATLNLGACWINQLHWLTDNAMMRDYICKLGINDNEDIFGSVVLGYPAQLLGKASPRKTGRIIRIK